MFILEHVRAKAVFAVLLAGLQHLKIVSDCKLETYKSAKTSWHYILAQSSG